jgi:Sulfotransferase domain
MMAGYSYQDGFDLRNGNIEIPSTSRPDFDSCYVFAFPKAGSVLLNNIVKMLMQDSGVPIIDIPADFFNNGVNLDTAVFDYSSLFLEKGYCYAGFRYPPISLQGMLRRLRGPKILMVRDPRDMLVSLFYSLKFSHPIPQQGTVQFYASMRSEIDKSKGTLDEFCLANASGYHDIYNRYAELIDDENVKIIRYEDIIFEKKKLAVLLCEWFSLDINQGRLNNMLAPLDIVPDTETPTEHIRQVKPGDHMRKLQASTIEFLNTTYRDFMRTFGYQASSI